LRRQVVDNIPLIFNKFIKIPGKFDADEKY